MVLRIHPGIGVARVGDSPESFIGPETVDIPPTPAGGYRDDEGRIRRQASRFRVFDDLTLVPGTSVTWSVTFGGAASNGTATISGVNQVVLILNGTTVMAELRTDAAGNLLVLSCQIDSIASNGCGDGPVHATVSGAPAVASWIVIIPPDFAPGILPRLPYSFLFRDWLCAHGFLSPPGPTTPVSFRREIYPAIRGRTAMSPTALLAAPDPTTAVPFYVAALGEPSNIEGSYLHSIVEHFHSGTLVNDWGIPTPLDPDALDLGPLSFVDGACPGGWELRFSGGGVQTATLPFASAELRFAPGAVTPGCFRRSSAGRLMCRRVGTNGRRSRTPRHRSVIGALGASWSIQEAGSSTRIRTRSFRCLLGCLPSAPCSAARQWLVVSSSHSRTTSAFRCRSSS